MERSLLILVILTVAGCKPAAPPPDFPISGIVNVDGEPLAAGKICFVHDGKQVFHPVKSGHFEGQAPAGMARVEIYAFPKKGDPKERENYLPSQYNKETTLSAEVTPDGPNEFKFDVTSK